MTVQHHESPAEFLGRGTVFIAYDGEGGHPHWMGYWDLAPDGPPTPLETGPGWTSAEAAVAWGRVRAPRVLIRVDENSGYLWAGDGEAPDDPDIEGLFHEPRT